LLGKLDAKETPITVWRDAITRAERSHEMVRMQPGNAGEFREGRVRERLIVQ
jgi:hypothetical protein